MIKAMIEAIEDVMIKIIESVIYFIYVLFLIGSFFAIILIIPIFLYLFFSKPELIFNELERSATVICQECGHTQQYNPSSHKNSNGSDSVHVPMYIPPNRSAGFPGMYF